MTKLVQRQIVAHGTMAALTMAAGRIDLADMEITKLMTALVARDRQGVMS